MLGKSAIESGAGPGLKFAISTAVVDNESSETSLPDGV